MLQYRLLLLCICLSANVGCVRQRIFRAEQDLRLQSEARETVLLQELDFRRSELALLIDKIAQLNRTLGEQRASIRDLETEIKQRAEQQGITASRQEAMIAALKQELKQHTLQLDEQSAQLERIQGIHRERAGRLSELFKTLADLYKDAIVEKKVELVSTPRAVGLQISDPFLFTGSGTDDRQRAIELLGPLARLVNSRPGIDVIIEGHTDNRLPLGSAYRDTWEWSAERALTILRLLIREYDVNPNQLSALGRGEFYPLVSNESSEGRLQNRRILIWLFPGLPQGE